MWLLRLICITATQGYILRKVPLLLGEKMKNGRGGGMAAGGKIENEDLKNKVKRGKEKGRKLHKKTGCSITKN